MIECQRKYSALWRKIWKRGKRPLQILLGVGAFLALTYYVALPFAIDSSPSSDALFGIDAGVLVPQSFKTSSCGVYDESPSWERGMRVAQYVDAMRDWVGNIGLLLVAIPIGFAWIALFVAACTAIIAAPVIAIVWLVCDVPVIFCAWWHLRRKRNDD